MAHTGQIVVNPVTGERITFLQTVADTGGQVFRAEASDVPQKARLPARVP
jgi:hypothetical protein